jgi:hypothetical protein
MGIITPGAPTEAPVKPFVAPGSRLGYVAELEQAQTSAAAAEWKKQKAAQKGPPTTPYIVVATSSSDVGARPISGDLALHSPNVEILDAAGNVVTTPAAGTTYRLRCTLENFGTVPTYSGVAQFYASEPQAIDQAAAGGTPPPLHGQASFLAAAGQTVTVDCPTAWTPDTAEEATHSILVNAYDLVSDPLSHPFDARNDRHVGRRDSIPDFSGVWDGTYGTATGPSNVIRIIVRQTGASVSFDVYAQVGGGLPSRPQDSIPQATISAGQIVATYIESLQGKPFTRNVFTLSLPTADSLHLNWVRRFLPPDTRGTHWLTGTLTRH